jgi:hypothetical protein
MCVLNAMPKLDVTAAVLDLFAPAYKDFAAMASPVVC